MSTDGSAQGQPAEKANHNTARSNKNTVAAPADLPGPAGAESAAQPIGKKGHDHYQNRSDAAAAAAAAGPDGSAVLPEGAGAASTGQARGCKLSDPNHTDAHTTRVNGVVSSGAVQYWTVHTAEMLSSAPRCSMMVALLGAENSGE